MKFLSKKTIFLLAIFLSSKLNDSFPAMAQGVSVGPTYDISSFSISGINLGMKDNEVSNILTSNGYNVKKDRINYTTDFLSKVKDRIANRSGKTSLEFSKSLTRVISSESYSKNDKENIFISYSQTPRGNIVSHIEYYILNEHIEWSSFLSSVKSKYGNPTFSRSRKRITADEILTPEPLAIVIYCNKGDASCLGMKNPIYPHLIVQSTVPIPLRRNITLRYGSKFFNELDYELESAIRQADPVVSKPSF